MRTLFICTTLALTANTASGQSLNIDINRTTGAGSGAPAGSFVGAAGQAGAWTAITASSTTPVALMDLDGSSSGVIIERTSGSGSDSDSVAGASLDYGKLVWDFAQAFQQGNSIEYTLSGLDQGFYRVYVYAALPGDSGMYSDGFGDWYHRNQLSATVGVLTQGLGETSGAVTPNEFQRGVTHEVFNVLVPAGSPAVEVRSACSFDTVLSYCALNGIQLVKVTGNKIFVDASAGAGLNTGLDWPNAFTDLQEAIAMAVASGGQIAEIWVADGTYKPTNDDNQFASFKLVNDVKILGGFAGGEISADQRDPAVNVATLSGAIGGPFSTDNCHHVVTALDTDNSAVLDGFTITSGYGYGPAAVDSSNSGGGLFISEGSPTIRNCLFTGNLAMIGAAVNIELGAPTFENCRFYNNQSEFEGGAMRFIGNTGLFAGKLEIANCIFVRNETDDDGGGLFIGQGGAWISNTIFNHNDAGHSGGAVMVEQPNTFAGFYNCTIYDNNAAISAGGVIAKSGASLIARNSILWGNHAGISGITAAQLAGAVDVTYSCVQVDGTVPFPFVGEGNMLSNPQFVNPVGLDTLAGSLDDDLHLSPVSPLIDKGSNSIVSLDFADLDHDGDTAEVTPFDLDGNARIIDGDDNGTVIVDMGAYETLPQSSCEADLNGDGSVNGTDLAMLLGAWGFCPGAGGCPADLDGSGHVTGMDLAVLLASWGACV